MATIRVRIPRPEAEAKALSEKLEFLFEDEGFPVAVFESSSDGRTWTAEVLVLDSTVEDATALTKAQIVPLLPEGKLPEDAEVVELPEINWVAKSLEGLKPVRAGRFVVHGSHDKDAVSTHDIGLEIEAALAFGTGHHGTTAGCLLELQRLLKRRRYERMLDLGTGTGVLAIGLAKLTNQEVLATDIDPIATKTALENAKLNGVAPLVKGFTAAGVDDRRFAEYGPFDLAVANILAKPLVQMSAKFARNMADQSTLVLSGLRVEDGPRIISAYSQQGFRLDRRGEIDGWLTLTLVRGNWAP
ncbi:MULTISPECIES: 50S ribosomal protein L11 methyltransferase [Pseudovibrio]|uniref:50S ribosomal protein L11 methyltransferase n=1 Tax=Stappiaceae TaxID=2821832 RepID=UPI0023673035|nr:MULTISPECIES: 50S ribosomal protein L11 methyltransferase [Pseudovibrio]MDD7910333.1 50S ribosomal protein L11 methyltransferase [Pseudovibrio exalbescens]MDX5594048.1 50S ribosomal protein L11 methyltransferase [Pseudovibrio sp. SPO723]